MTFQLPGQARLEEVASAISAAAARPLPPAPTLLHSAQALGGLTLPNRVVMAAMATGFASPEGLPTPRLIAWYGARATGGAGLVIVEGARVAAPHPTASRSRFGQHFLRLDADGVVPAFVPLVAAIHRGGARAAIQLTYPAVHDPASLTGAELGEIVAAFGRAAEQAQAAGFDAVEVQCTYRSLFAQLLSPATNSRGDKYGRGPAGRLRALRDAIAAIRSATTPGAMAPGAARSGAGAPGPTTPGTATLGVLTRAAAVPGAAGSAFPVIVKFSADEYLPRGLTPARSVEIARALREAGVSALEILAGAVASDAALRLSSGVGEAVLADLAGRIREVVDVPVIAAGRLLTGDGSEGVLHEGQADLVALGRTLLADPAWTAKVRAGVEQEVSPCISCMACFTPAPDGGIGCPVNGEAGQEHLPPLDAAERPRHIAILGASLAGLELARTAAARGHRVTLVTAGLPLGGLLGLRAGVPGNAEFGRAFLYHGDRLVELGVSIAADDEVATLGAHVTVDCRPQAERRPHWGQGRGVFPAGDVLRRDLHEMYGIGRRIAVAGPGVLAAEVALFLAGWGRRPTAIVPGEPDNPFPDAHPTHAARLQERLQGYKVLLVTGATPLEWRYDPGRKSQLLVRRAGREEVLGPFHTAITAEGWPAVPRQGPRVPSDARRSRPAASSLESGGSGNSGGAGNGHSRHTGSSSSRDDPWPAANFLWPAAVFTPEVPETVPDGTTLLLEDTLYPEPLRDLVLYAHRLGRVL